MGLGKRRLTLTEKLLSRIMSERIRQVRRYRELLRQLTEYRNRLNVAIEALERLCE